MAFIKCDVETGHEVLRNCIVDLDGIDIFHPRGDSVTAYTIHKEGISGFKLNTTIEEIQEALEDD